MANAEKKTFVVALRAASDRDAYHELKGLLKVALRRHGFCCVGVREETVCCRDARQQTVTTASVVTTSAKKEGTMPSAKRFGFKNKWIKLEDVRS